MKPIIRFFFMLVVPAIGISAFSSCSDDWKEPYLKITETDVRVGSSTEQVTIPIETNTHWQLLSALPSWLTVENKEGKNASDLVIEVAANSSFERSCDLVVVASTSMETIKLTQAASTSGKLAVTTGNCTVTGILSNYTLTISFTVTNPHLASRAGIIYGGRQYGCESLGNYCYVQIAVQTLSPYGGTYQAYAVDKSTGEYVYGAIKTISK